MIKWYNDVININDDHLWMSTSKQSVLINVLKVVLVQRRIEPDDDDDNHNDDEVDDDVVDDDVVDDDGVDDDVVDDDGVDDDVVDDDVVDDDGVDDDGVDDDGVDEVDLSLLQPAANVAFLLFCSASHSSKPLYHTFNQDYDE